MDRVPMIQSSGNTPSVSGSRAASTREVCDRLPALYAGLRGIVRPVLKRVFGFRVSGLEHLPESGPFIVAANHANYLDGVVLGAALPRKIVFLVMPRVYRATPLHPYFHRHIGSIPIELTRPDPGAIRGALRTLDRGGVVGIFPEGPFGRSGRLMPGQPGVALVALRSGVPVVPAAITGTAQALWGRRWHIPRRMPFHVRFGRPLRFPRPSRRPLGHTLRDDVTGRIMAEIAALLPDEQRPAPDLAGAPRSG
jgi:1-acyl-sn-glycerol-3-phosphate acyltransferase